MIKYLDTEGTNLTVHGMDTYLLRYNQTPHFEPGNIILSQSFTKKKKQNFFGWMATNQHLLNTAINAFNIQKLSSDLPFTRDINDLAVFTLAARVLWPDSINM